MEIIERLKAPTPKFWKKVQRVCGIIGGAAGVLLLLPVALPAMLITGAGYVVFGASLGIALAQATREDGSIDLSKLSLDQMIELRNKFTAIQRPMTSSERAALAHVSKLISDAGK